MNEQQQLGWTHYSARKPLAGQLCQFKWIGRQRIDRWTGPNHGFKPQGGKLYWRYTGIAKEMLGY